MIKQAADGGGGSAGHFGVREKCGWFSKLQNEYIDTSRGGDVPRTGAASGVGVE